MKKHTFTALILLAIAVVIGSCIKNNTTPRDCAAVTAVAPAAETARLKQYLDSTGTTAIQDSRGFFYNLDLSGSTDTLHPTVCSDVSVTYTVTYLNGDTLETSGPTTPISLNLSGTITGWQEAIPLMKKNANMVLYLPPSLAYGSSDYQGVPGNSYLIFTIKLWGFN